ncbi:hypothetical protein [Lysinibacillus xylanilyticus]|uniref:hypothetical protein n=1 Tax=Lysinibacillus xylanilyticus TaxID=582475 RepID=UPI0037FE0800
MQLVLEKPDVYKPSHVNQDNLWKKLIADLFEDFLLFFLPDLHAEVKASSGCHGIGKEFFVQAQSRFWTQLCRGIIDSKLSFYSKSFSKKLLSIVKGAK